MTTITAVQPRPANQLPAFNEKHTPAGHSLSVTDVSNRSSTARPDRHTVLDTSLHAVMQAIPSQASHVAKLTSELRTSQVSRAFDQQGLRQLRKAIRKDRRTLTPSIRCALRSRVTHLLKRHRRHHTSAPGTRAAASLVKTRERQGREHLRLKLNVLDDLARVGWYEHQHSRLQERARRRLEQFSQPAASNLRSCSISARLGIGLPSLSAQTPGGELSIGTTRTRTHELFSVDTGEVGAGHSRTHTLDVAADATIAAPLSVGARASASSMRGDYLFADSAPNFALIQARRDVAHARMPRHRGHTAGMLRRLGSAVQPARDRYASAQLRALRWEKLLPTLTGTPEARIHDMLGNGRRPDLQHVHVQTLSGTAGAHARGIALDGAVSLGADRTRIHVDVPLDPATTPLTPVEHRQALAQYRQRLSALASVQRPQQRMDGTVARSASAKLVPLFSQPADAVTLQQRRDLGNSILSEFQNARLLAARCHAEPPSRQPTKALAHACGQWGCKDIHTLAARMQDALNWLLLSAPDAGGPQHDALVTCVRTALDEIRSFPTAMTGTPKPDSTSIYRRLEQDLSTTTVSLSARVASDLAAAGLSVSMAHTTRQDFNPLRSGRSIELTIDARGSVGIAPLLNLLKEHAPEADNVIAADIATAINENVPTASGQVDAMIRLHVRLFKPDYQHDKDFPAQARGMRLQQVRLIGQYGASADLTGSVPVATGITAGGGLAFRTQRTRAMAPDHFPAGTISGLLLRYKSLSDQTGESTPPWQRLCMLHGKSLRALHATWAKETSPASQETRYWLRRHPDASAHDQMELQWSAVTLHPFDPARMKTVFDHLLAAVRSVQCQSDRISPAYLPALDGAGRPVLDPPLVTRL